MTKLLIVKTKEFDISEIISMEMDIENSQFIFPNSKEEHLYLIKDDNIEHLLLKSEENEIIGFAILAGLKNRNGDIEFRRIVIKHKDKGFGRVAIKSIKEYSFIKLNCHRLWLDVLKSNKRAVYLYKSEGFKKEGALSKFALTEKKNASLLIYSMLKSAYKDE